MSHQKTTVVVIGASGQVGHALLCAAWPANTCLVGIARNTSKLTIPSHVTLLDRELVGSEEVLSTLEEVNPTVVINAAAYTGVDKAETEAEAASALNADFPATLAKWCDHTNTLLVHYSTDYVYHGEGEEPLSEDSPKNPQSVYAKTKLAGDKAVLSMTGKAMVFRVSWVYSAHGQNFVKTMLRLASERPSLSVVSDQWGPPTSADLIADASVHAIECFLSRPEITNKLATPSLFHICPEGWTNWCDLAKQSFEEYKQLNPDFQIPELSPITTEQYPTPAKRPKNSRMLNDKFKRTFDYNFEGWKASLKKVIKKISHQSPP